MSKLICIIFSFLFLNRVMAAPSPYLEMYEQLVKKSDQIIGLEVITSGSSKDDLNGKFGHSMIRFVDNDSNVLNDFVISFAARSSDVEFSKMKAVIGGYEVAADIRTLGEFWKQYVISQDRPLYRYIIASNKQLRTAVIQELANWLKNPENIGSYTLLTNNCVSVIAKLLARAGYPNRGLRPIVPLYFDSWAEQNLMSPYPALISGTIDETLNKLSSILQIDRQLISHLENWPMNSTEIILANLDDTEIKQILVWFPFMNFETRQKLLVDHSFRNGLASYDHIVNLEKIPTELYSFCTDLPCASKIITLEKNIWGEEKSKDMNRIRDWMYSWAMGWSSSDENVVEYTFDEDIKNAQREYRKAPELFNHYQLLLKAAKR